jgi:hypothetical protein
MEENLKKFLDFNGQSINFLAVDGIYWIAVKPICKALNIDDQSQFEFINNLQKEIDQLCSDEDMKFIKKTDQPYGDHRTVDYQKTEKIVSEQLMQAADGKIRNMLCISEEYVYGWLFQIQATNKPELQKFKLKCYKLLYDYFHGTITSRFEILKEKTETDLEIERLEEELKQSDSYKKLQELKSKRTNANKQLNKLDKAVIEEKYDLWHQDWVLKTEQTTNEKIN